MTATPEENPMTATLTEPDLELHRARVVTISDDPGGLTERLRAVYWDHARVGVLVPKALLPDLYLGAHVAVSVPIDSQGGRTAPGPTRYDLVLRRLRAVVRDAENAGISAETLLGEVVEGVTRDLTRPDVVQAIASVRAAYGDATQRGH